MNIYYFLLFYERGFSDYMTSFLFIREISQVKTYTDKLEICRFLTHTGKLEAYNFLLSYLLKKVYIKMSYIQKSWLESLLDAQEEIIKNGDDEFVEKELERAYKVVIQVQSELYIIT